MTYNKKLIEITITMVSGQTFTLSDTAEDQKASLALAQIKRGGNVLIEGDSSNTLVLASAIVQVEITQLEDAEVERANPYGCEAGGGGDQGEVWFTGTIDTSQQAQDGYRPVFPLTVTEIADIEALIADPTNYSVSINGVELPYYRTQFDNPIWGSNEDGSIPQTTVVSTNNMWIATVPEDWTGDVSVTVAHK